MLMRMSNSLASYPTVRSARWRLVEVILRLLALYVSSPCRVISAFYPMVVCLEWGRRGNSLSGAIPSRPSWLKAGERSKGRKSCRWDANPLGSHNAAGVGSLLWATKGAGPDSPGDRTQIVRR